MHTVYITTWWPALFKIAVQFWFKKLPEHSVTASQQLSCICCVQSSYSLCGHDLSKSIFLVFAEVGMAWKFIQNSNRISYVSSVKSDGQLCNLYINLKFCDIWFFARQHQYAMFILFSFPFFHFLCATIKHVPKQMKIGLGSCSVHYEVAKHSSFLTSTMVGGDVIFYLKFAVKVTHPL